MGYVVVWFLVARIFLTLLISPGIPHVAAAIVATALDVGAVILGARIFRSRNEDPLPPRPWWQLTGRPRAGFVIAGFVFVGWVLSFGRELADLQTVDWPALVVGSVVNLATAIAYIRSSVLLLRRDAA